MEDISIYSTTTSSSQQEESREGTRKRLEKLKTDKRFDKVEPSIKNKIIDSAIETVTKLGSQKKENIKSFLMASPLILIPFVGTLIFEAYSRVLPQTIRHTKEVIYAKVEEGLEKLNKLDKDQQTRLTQGLATQSKVSDVIPNMPKRTYGISLVGAGAGSESKEQSPTNITSLHDEISDRIKKGKMSFEPQKRR
jgi:hypothetical protein